MKLQRVCDCSTIRRNKTIKDEIIAWCSNCSTFSLSIPLTPSLNEKISKTLFYYVTIVLYLLWWFKCASFMINLTLSGHILKFMIEISATFLNYKSSSYFTIFVSLYKLFSLLLTLLTLSNSSKFLFLPCQLSLNTKFSHKFNSSSQSQSVEK